MYARSWMLLMLLPFACQCDRTIEHDSDGATSMGASTTSGSSSASSSEESTGAPFDASRWLGRYHYEFALMTFGEAGPTHGAGGTLANFEILADGTATMLHEYCGMIPSQIVKYEWVSDEPDWLALHPGEGETSLRYNAATDLDSLRVHMIGPCRELELEADGQIVDWTTFKPGASCWVRESRCFPPDSTHIDYCEGEEPPPCP
jgi:hypothetical protein